MGTSCPSTNSTRTPPPRRRVSSTRTRGTTTSRLPVRVAAVASLVVDLRTDAMSHSQLGCVGTGRGEGDDLKRIHTVFLSKKKKKKKKKKNVFFFKKKKKKKKKKK